MREIKFRGWNKNVKRMLDLKTITPLALDSKMSTEGLFIPFCDEVALMQYTGLKDKNGKEIYEGDVIKSPGDYTEDHPRTLDEPRLVEMQNGCWCFNAHRHAYRDEPDYILFGYWTASNQGSNVLKQIEVIGNIYENLELLKEGNDV